MGHRDRHAEQTELTRERLLDAAIIEFSQHGFEAASTRSIAQRAGCHQPQINYHFASKQALWEAALSQLFARLTALFGDLDDISDPTLRFETAIRRFVAFSAECPELHRLMVVESLTSNERLAWIVENHTKALYKRTCEMWREVRASGRGVAVDERVIYHTVIGAASILWTNEPEAHVLEPAFNQARKSIVQAHADALVTLFLPDHRSQPAAGVQLEARRLQRRSKPKASTTRTTRKNTTS